MEKDRKTPADSMISPHDLLIASLITAMGVATFAAGYWGGRGVGSILFN